MGRPKGSKNRPKSGVSASGLPVGGSAAAVSESSEVNSGAVSDALFQKTGDSELSPSESSEPSKEKEESGGLTEAEKAERYARSRPDVGLAFKAARSGVAEPKTPDVPSDSVLDGLSGGSGGFPAFGFGVNPF